MLESNRATAPPECAPTTYRSVLILEKPNAKPVAYFVCICVYTLSNLPSVPLNCKICPLSVLQSHFTVNTYSATKYDRAPRHKQLQMPSKRMKTQFPWTKELDSIAGFIAQVLSKWAQIRPNDILHFQGVSTFIEIHSSGMMTECNHPTRTPSEMDDKIQ